MLNFATILRHPSVLQIVLLWFASDWLGIIIGPGGDIQRSILPLFMLLLISEGCTHSFFFFSSSKTSHLIGLPTNILEHGALPNIEA
jgi:hypothetical protein